MAVQQNKVSKSRRNKRRSHHALLAANFQECPKCGEMKRTHHVCSVCGFYDGREVVVMQDDFDLDEDLV
ncbi:MAG: 50S ribosomal protein L32 [Aestuariivita sp.]|nr:50S ribosomal protein L32 [Aestuariivita sp.]MCY4347503.1 50S ribosomal protein L32 [Aestuariivita sp.]